MLLRSRPYVGECGPASLGPSHFFPDNSNESQLSQAISSLDPNKVYDAKTCNLYAAALGAQGNSSAYAIAIKSGSVT